MSDSPTSEPESDFVCDCDEQVRSACAGQPFYKEHEGKRYCVFHFPGKEKSADFRAACQRKLHNKDFNFCGVWFPDEVMFYELSATADFSHATFSADAYFANATFSAEANFNSTTFNAAAYFSDATFGATNFCYATFNAEADFNGATFGAESYFSDATFSTAAYFISATFNAAGHFSSATFSAVACFVGATFSANAYFSDAAFGAVADFRSATFSGNANFKGATFRGDANFGAATLSAEAHFREATFRDYFKFAGNENRLVFGAASSLDLQFARIERPDLISFHTLSLHPHWFVNVDARKFDFTNVKWDWRTIDEEIKSLQKRSVSSPHRLLAIACRHLAVNAEENHRYEEASKFRYMAMNAQRLETWPRFAFWRRWFAFWRLSWWYWLASGYGERVFRAFVVLLGIWFLGSLLYTRVGFARWEPKLANESDVAIAKLDDVGAPLSFKRSLTYSLGVMTLQKPEPRPATTAAQTVVLLQTILGPVQAALLALAIRRKFMR